jgi:hypothetical protein
LYLDGGQTVPVYNYYALPAYIPLVNFAAMGYWRSGDKDLLHQLEPLINNRDPLHGTDWQKMVALMRKRLANALVSDSPDKSQNPD